MVPEEIHAYLVINAILHVMNALLMLIHPLAHHVGIKRLSVLTTSQATVIVNLVILQIQLAKLAHLLLPQPIAFVKLHCQS